MTKANGWVWFLPEGTFDPYAPTVADLEKGIKYPAHITWGTDEPEHEA